MFPVCFVTHVPGLYPVRSRHGPALARRPSRLVNSLVWAAARRPQRVDSHAASGVPRRLRHVGPGRAA
jgi:hypothetical protein